jgi:hypothetical protein
MLPFELALRAVNAGLGLVGLLLLLNAGGLLRGYALLMPVGVAVSLLFDAGRTELVLRLGLAAGLASTIPRKLAISGLAAAACVLGASRLPVGQTGILVTAISVSAIAQVYVDIALRHSLFQRRSVLFVSWFQFACAAINALLAWAGRQGLAAPELAVAGLVVTPAAVALLLRRQLLKDAIPDAEGTGAGGEARTRAGPRARAVAFRVAPSAGYSLYLYALHRLAPSLEATARALYFIFGFLHIRAMARHRQGSWWRSAASMTLVALATSVPLLAFDRPPSGALGPVELAWGGILLAAFALAGAKYLDLYARFLDGG